MLSYFTGIIKSKYGKGKMTDSVITKVQFSSALLVCLSVQIVMIISDVYGKRITQTSTAIHHPSSIDFKHITWSMLFSFFHCRQNELCCLDRHGHCSPCPSGQHSLPCQDRSSRSQYDEFIRRHILQDEFNRSLPKEWEK